MGTGLGMTRQLLLTGVAARHVTASPIAHFTENDCDSIPLVPLGALQIKMAQLEGFQQCNCVDIVESQRTYIIESNFESLLQYQTRFRENRLRAPMTVMRERANRLDRLIDLAREAGGVEMPEHLLELSDVTGEILEALAHRLKLISADET